MLNNFDIFIQSHMVKVPEGIVDLRDDRTKREWKVSIKSFLLAKYPVTNELYCEVLNQAQVNASENKKPVVNLSWHDAIAFCNLLSTKHGLEPCYAMNSTTESIICDWNATGFRLPSEAEWQYACKAGTPGYRYGELNDIAWFQDNSNGFAHVVGEKQPNAWGLYDMLGNVWEWCWDVYDEKVYGTYRVFRGGSWAEEERGCGATCRRRSHPTFAIDDLGFRLARSIV